MDCSNKAKSTEVIGQEMTAGVRREAERWGNEIFNSIIKTTDFCRSCLIITVQKKISNNKSKTDNFLLQKLASDQQHWENQFEIQQKTKLSREITKFPFEQQKK